MIEEAKELQRQRQREESEKRRKEQDEKEQKEKENREAFEVSRSDILKYMPPLLQKGLSTIIKSL